MSDYTCRHCRHWGNAEVAKSWRVGEDPDMDRDSPRSGMNPCALTSVPGYRDEPTHPKSLAIAAGTEGSGCLYTAPGFGCSQFSEKRE